jgi:hypothetical protein
MLDDKSTSEVTCMAMNDSPALSVLTTKNNAPASKNSLTELDRLLTIERMRWFQIIGTLAVILTIPVSSLCILKGR